MSCRPPPVTPPGAHRHLRTHHTHARTCVHTRARMHGRTHAAARLSCIEGLEGSYDADTAEADDRARTCARSMTVRAHAGKRADARAHVRARMSVRARVRARVWKRVRALARMCMRRCARLRTHACVGVRACVRMHACVRAHACVHACARARVCAASCIAAGRAARICRYTPSAASAGMVAARMTLPAPDTRRNGWYWPSLPKRQR